MPREEDLGRPPAANRLSPAVQRGKPANTAGPPGPGVIPHRESIFVTIITEPVPTPA